VVVPPACLVVKELPLVEVVFKVHFVFKLVLLERSFEESKSQKQAAAYNYGRNLVIFDVDADYNTNL